MAFAPRPAYEFALHADEPALYTRFAGQNPPEGALIFFYQANPGAAPPAIDVLDGAGRVVRRIAGTRRVDEREMPLLSNDSGINRVIWDLRENGPVRWMGAAREEYRGPRVGVHVVPGRYTVRLVLGATTFREPLEVRPDPRSRLGLAQLREVHDFYARGLAEYSQIDAALNRLDSVAASATHSVAAARKRSDGSALAAQLEKTLERARTLRAVLTADYRNDEDSLQRPGALREDFDIFTRGFVSGVPNAALRTYAARLDVAFRASMRDVAGFFATDVAQSDAALHAAGLPPLADVANPPEPPK
jgi:hypothetical protein